MCGVLVMLLALGLVCVVLILAYVIGVYGFPALGLCAAYLVLQYTARSPAAGVALGAVLSVVVTAVVERAKRPSLRLVLMWDGQPRRFWFGGRDPEHLADVLFLQATNKPLPCEFRFLGRATATEVAGSVCFRDCEGHPAFVELRCDRATGTTQEWALRMPVRWANSPQPSRTVWAERVGRPQSAPWMISDPERLVQTQRIRPGGPEDARGGVNDGTFSVAVKFGTDEECYGFTNESYRHGFRHPRWRLTLPYYLVDVEVTSADGECNGLYRLSTGTGGCEAFELTRASRIDSRKVDVARRGERSRIVTDPW